MYGSDKDVFQTVGSAADVGSNHHSMGGYLLHELFSHHTLPPMRENMGSWSSTELPTM